MFPFLREYWNSKTLLPINKIITFKLLISVRLFRWNSTRNGIIASVICKFEIIKNKHQLKKYLLQLSYYFQQLPFKLSKKQMKAGQLKKRF